jgi:hypothetical protein
MRVRGAEHITLTEEKMNAYEVLMGKTEETLDVGGRIIMSGGRDTLYPLKLALASLTGGDRSIGIVR